MTDTINYDAALKYVSENIREYLMNLPNSIKADTYEIRLRSERPISIYGAYGSLFFKKNNEISYDSAGCVSSSQCEVTDTFNRLCLHSVYTFQSDINRGYIPMENGNRAGVCGSAVCENDVIHSIKDITSINIRISHEIKGCADEIISKMGQLKESFIIAGPPSSGKTTMIRDIVRQLSNYRCGYKKTAVIDERREISGIVNCKITKDIGVTSDVFDSYPKSEAIDIAVRVFSPDYIVCDEVSTPEEINAIIKGLNCGVGFILTVHCGSENELFSRIQIKRLISSKAFKKIFLLGTGKNIGKIIKEFVVEDLTYEINSRSDNCSADFSCVV